MKVGFLGPLGTYTEAAAAAWAPEAPREPYGTILAVFEGVAKGQVEAGVVPYENVIHGPVTETLDALYRFAHNVQIVDMVLLPIEHALGALPKHQQIRQVLSKDQALQQCSVFLDKTYPDAARVATASTSAAMKRIVDEKLSDCAAIGSPWSLEHYGLVVEHRNIGNTAENKTRFAVLKRVHEQTSEPTGNDATAFAIYPHRNRIGLLEDILQIISKRYELNLCSIHSRPDALGAFRFYMELEGHRNDSQIAACLQTLQTELATEEVEVLIFGSYPRSAFNQHRIRTIGLVGGTGAMGQWFRRFFEHAGYRVLVAGRTTALTYEECIAQSDVVLINVPIENTLETIKKLAPRCKPNQLLLDNTSIKTRPVEAMLLAAPAQVEVLGMHTVFGPAVEQLRGQNVVFTRTERSKALSKEFENIFYKHGAHITHTTPEYHDRQMAFHQNLEHFIKIALANVIADQFANIEELDRYSSPNSRLSLASMGRILNANPDLVAEIQMFNEAAPTLIQSFVEYTQGLLDALQKHDSQTFKDALKKGQNRLGKVYIQKLADLSKRLQTLLD